MIAEPKDFRSMALRLLDSGYVPVFGEFNDQLEEIVIEAILAAKSKKMEKLTLLINSKGGSNTCYGSIKAAMVESGIKFDGLVMGYAYSNAFNLLQQCQRRLATRDSYLMFHWGWQKLYNSELAAIIAGETWPIELARRSELVTAEFVSERSGVSVADLINFALYERAFTGEMAKEMGFVDEIIADLPDKAKEGISGTTQNDPT